jgi:hypothetical protein
VHRKAAPKQEADLDDSVHREEHHAEGDVTQQSAAHTTVHAGDASEVIFYSIAD